MKILLALLAAASLTLSSLNAAAANFSDMWWNPQEPGTGLQVTQQGEIAFVTLFTYAANNEPLWFVASDARIYAISGATGLPAFRGTLYRTRGTPFSDAHKPGDMQVIPVGTIYLTPTSGNALDVEYTVNNVTVTKKLVRQTFAIPGGAFNYVGTFTLRFARAEGEAPFGTREYDADLRFLVDEQNTAVFRVSEPVDGNCDYRGPYSQSGRYAEFSGTFTCDSGSSGTFAVSQLEFTDAGVTGMINTAGRDGVGRGRFGAVRR